MQILMFFPGQVDQLPPLMTAAASMAGCGAHVRVVASGCAAVCRDYLRRHKVEVVIEHEGHHPKTRLARGYLRMRVGVRLLKEIRRMNPECVWFHGPFAMQYALVPGMNMGKVIVAHAYELCDRDWLLQRVQARCLRRAAIVIVPEINRLWMLKVKTQSSAAFHCVANRLLDDTLPASAVDPITRREFVRNGGSEHCARFIIYQGAFMSGRCLFELVRAFRSLPFADVGLILMGQDVREPIACKLHRLAEDDKRLVILPRRTPPMHLEITQGCVAGVVLYSPTCLNNVYCAPNKIFEYAAMGLGMILPHYPGLMSINNEFHIGEVCDPLSPASICEAMGRLLERGPEYYRTGTDLFLKRALRPRDSYSRVYDDLALKVKQLHGVK